MENGGNKEHRPWMFDNTNQTLNTYIDFVTIHMELLPYFLNAAAEAYANGTSVMSPIAEYTDFTPSSWDYWLWTDIYVSPMVQNTTQTTINFPSGFNFVDWWNGTVYQGGSTIQYDVPYSQFPVFHRQGSMLALNVTNSRAHHGTEYSEGALTLLVSQLGTKEKTAVREWKGLSQELSYEYFAETQTMHFSATAHTRDIILLVRGVTIDEKVFQVANAIGKSKLEAVQSHQELKEKGAGWMYENHNLWIRPGNGSKGVFTIVHGVKNI